MNINSEAMAEEPREEEVMVRLTAATGPQIISSESISPGPAGGAGVPGGAGGVAGAASARGAAAGAELGRRLLLAARAGDAQAVVDLMAQGAPFTTDWLGTSPLHLACAGGHVAAAGVLLRAGVSRDARTKVDRTPLHLAAHAGHARVAALLLEHGALPDTRDMLQMTPLHWACARGHAALAALLARRGASPRARCKFGRTPLTLAAPAVRTAVRAALRERAQLAAEEAATDDPLAASPPDDDKPTTRIQQKVTKPNIEIESGPAEPTTAAAGAGGAAAGAAEGARAAALLRQHGITLLPVDDTSTVLSALQSGRTVVLSDAGKLMLKENSSPPTAAPVPPEPPSPTPAPAARGGVVVRACPARSPPRPGVKVFTVNKLPTKLPKPAAAPAPAPAPAPAQLKKILDPQDMQIKYVQLPPEPTAVAGPVKTPMKAKARAAGGAGGAGPAGRGGVKIIMNKASFSKLVATAARAHSSGDNEPLAPLSGCGEAVVCVPEQFVRSMSARYLRAQLLAAHAALAAMSRELRAARRDPS